MNSSELTENKDVSQLDAENRLGVNTGKAATNMAIHMLNNFTPSFRPTTELTRT